MAVWIGLTGGVGAVALVLSAAVYVWRDDILLTQLYPKEPFQIYDPPAAPAPREP